MIEQIHAGCGGTIIGLELLSYPPIHQLRCNKCGKVLSETREKIELQEITF
jgi:hypothetical protein